MRLKSMIPAMPVMVFSFLGYAWTAQERVSFPPSLTILVRCEYRQEKICRY
jgi:hypothetical protein